MSTSIAAASAANVPMTDTSFGSTTACLSSEERLLALIVYSQTSQMNEAKTSVNLNAEQLEQLREQVKKALDEAREAKKDQGFWGGLAKIFGSDLATIASAVAAVAAVVATGGAAAAVLAVVAAAATLAADHAKELGIPTEVAMVIAITASVAGLCCGDAGGLFKVSATVKEVAGDVKLGAEVSAYVYKAEGAGCGMVAARYERDAGHFHADARFAEGRQDIVSTDIDESLDRLAAALEHQGDAAELASRIQRQDSASSHAILSNWAGAA
jgi:hypothetical protein